MMKYEGRHLLGNYQGCNPAALEDVYQLEVVFRDAAQAAGVKVVQSLVHHFPPNAITVLLLLAESHASIHTYPESQSCFVDFFTCGSHTRPEEFDRLLQEYLQPSLPDVKICLRPDVSLQRMSLSLANCQGIDASSQSLG